MAAITTTKYLRLYSYLTKVKKKQKIKKYPSPQINCFDLDNPNIVLDRKKNVYTTLPAQKSLHLNFYLLFYEIVKPERLFSFIKINST